MRHGLSLGLLLLTLASCNSKTVDPVPGPTVDMTGYFVRPATGFFKVFTDGASQTYLQDTIVNMYNSVDVLYPSGSHEYHRIPDRAWVGTYDPSGAGLLFLLGPPLAAIPEAMPETSDHVANSGFVTQTGLLPVRRVSRLIDTALIITVPAGTFDSVILIRQQFFVFGENGVGIPDTTIDSTYRWFAPGVDEIRRVLWRDGEPDSTLREMSAGTLNGTTYPIP
jgi:hypothetical protein